MNFDEIVKKVETLDGLTLDQLFELWKDAQKAEKGWEKNNCSSGWWKAYGSFYRRWNYRPSSIRQGGMQNTCGIKGSKYR